MNPDLLVQYMLLCAILIDATLGWAVLLKNPKHASNQSYFVVVCCTTLWQVATFVSMFVIGTDAERIFSYRLMCAAVIAELVSVMYFVNTFGYEEHQPTWVRIVVASMLCETVLVVASPYVFHYSQGIEVTTGALYPYSVFVVCALIAGIFASIIQRLIMVNAERERTQLEYMIIGLFVPMLFGVFSMVIVPFLEMNAGVIHISSIQVFGAATTVFFSFMMAYAMARHRLMDIRVVLKRRFFALMSTFVVVLCMALVTLYALRDVMQFTVWTTMILLIIFSVVTLGVYAMVSRMLSAVVKRGAVDLVAYTHDEELFMRNIQSPRTWARRWAAKLQKEFAVESLECVTYDHRAQCWRQVFPESRTKYALEEGWIRVPSHSQDLRNTSCTTSMGVLHPSPMCNRCVL
ncbi:MAG: hypothetical protein KIH62_003395, partial [Candidatus Kerfeldbacteria bacterium]|nr:hypothetical protein [Candidatus Kerfeldbacteria bacterium]